MNLFDFFKFFSLAHSEIAENGAGKVLSSEEENSSVHKTYVNFPTSRKSALNVPLYAISILFSFFCRGLQMRRNFLTTCTTLGTRGKKLQADAALCGRIAKNGADAKPCLSDVYKSGTRARRRQADVPLCGRSMVEMLGVLAIIGVLSVGAISGYSKAMMKYKLNKQAEAMNLLFNTVLQYIGRFQNNSTDDTPEFYGEILTKLNVLPDGIKQSSSNSKYLTDIFGNSIWVYAYPSSAGIGYNFAYRGDRKEICRNLLNVYKANSHEIYFVTTDRRHTDEDSGETTQEKNNRYYGDKYCTADSKCLNRITIEDVNTLCNQCSENSTECRIYVSFIP